MAESEGLQTDMETGRISNLLSGYYYLLSNGEGDVGYFD